VISSQHAATTTQPLLEIGMNKSTLPDSAPNRIAPARLSADIGAAGLISIKPGPLFFAVGLKHDDSVGIMPTRLQRRA